MDNMERINMANTMKAAVVTAFNQPLQIQEVEIPKISPGKVLVKIIATGVCHTDLHAMHGDWPVKPSLPFIPGHEGVGEVIEIGEGIDHLKVGDIVGVPWLYSACGHCDHCYAGWETLCKKQQNSGYSVNGSFAEYCLADGDYVGVIPEGVDLLEIAPILCAGVTVYKGLKMTEAKTGDWVAISGIGGLGHVAVQYAKTMGFNVVAIDVDDTKLDLAKSLGADVGLNALKVDVKEEVLKATGGEGCHGVLVTAVSPKAFEQAVAHRPSWWDHGFEWFAARHIRLVHFQYGTGRDYGTWFDCRNTFRPERSTGYCCAWQGQGSYSCGTTRKY